MSETCPGHERPQKKEHRAELPCCKLLRATPAPAKIDVGHATTAFTLQPDLSADFQFLDSRSEAPAFALATGPPWAHTFAESVLQRSLLAHAPPCLS